MKSPWEIPKSSPFTSSKADKRNFGRNNGAKGGALPTFVRPKTEKPKVDKPVKKG